MPDGNYQSGNILFGGFDRESTGMARFDRSRLAESARNASFLAGTSPIYSIFEVEVQEAIGGGDGKAAIVLVSDGLGTDYAGRSEGLNERTVAAARDVVASRSGQTCFHTVQVGQDPAGTALLQGISGVSSCGSFRNASSLGTASALQAFSREVYLGGAASAPSASTTGQDSDGDGVPDATDECPGTLRGARVDRRGCWTLKKLEFAVNGSAIDAAHSASLQEDADVLAANPEVRVRIDGHTDSDGSAAYNQRLSEERAKTVRDYLVNERGIEASRIEVKGFGESQPIAPNDSAANKARNRRVEITVLD
jgi:OOP family OmpA-OmpF porin